MSALITIVHVIICVILIVVVLLQSGKAADLAGAFGGGGSATAFGGRGNASLLSKVTEVCAILFMITSLGLWILSGHEGSSAVSGVKPKPVPVQNTTETTETTKPPAQTTAPQTQKPAANVAKKDDKPAVAAKPADKIKTNATQPSTAPPDKRTGAIK